MVDRYFQGQLRGGMYLSLGKLAKFLKQDYFAVRRACISGRIKVHRQIGRRRFVSKSTAEKIKKELKAGFIL